MTIDTRCPHCGGKMLKYQSNLVCENDWYNISTGEKGSCPMAGLPLPNRKSIIVEIDESTRMLLGQQEAE